MKRFLQKLKYAPLVASVAVVSSPAFATIETDAETAITAAKDSALTVGGYVVAAVAGLVVIGLVISMVRKI